MIKVADVTHLFNPDWDTILSDIHALTLKPIDAGEFSNIEGWEGWEGWGGWGVLTKTGSHTEGFASPQDIIKNESGKLISTMDGRNYLTWSAAGTPAIRKAIQQVRQYGLLPSRARISTLEPHSKIKWHTDGDELFHRLHFVIKTNAKAFFETEEQLYHLEERHVYIFNTNYPHRIVNDGDEVRIHLMMDLNMQRPTVKLCEGHWLPNL